MVRAEDNHSPPLGCKHESPDYWAAYTLFGTGDEHLGLRGRVRQSFNN